MQELIGGKVLWIGDMEESVQHLKAKGLIRIISLAVILICAVGGMAGCTVKAPMQVWKPSNLISRPVRSLAIAPPDGHPRTAEQLQNALLSSKPQHNQLAVIDPEELARVSPVQLVSYSGASSDIAALTAARQAKADVLVESQVVRDDLDVATETEGLIFQRTKKQPRLTITLKVVDVASGETKSDSTISIDAVTAEKLYPDLVYYPGNQSDRVVVAVARQSWDQLAPHLQREEIVLAKPWLSLGSARVRKGIKEARLGRWDLAEAHWQDAVDAHPWNIAGWHNLAMAAVAKEDFELARNRLKHSDSLFPIDHAEEARVWLEELQRDYHTAFHLPPPPGGWTLPVPPAPTTGSDVPTTKPTDIDELPWWTAIPFTKPPGWTWRAWLSQPLGL